MLRLLGRSMRMVLLVAITFSVPSGMRAGWKARLARVDITPAGSMWMAAGWLGRDRVLMIGMWPVAG